MIAAVEKPASKMRYVRLAVGHRRGLGLGDVALADRGCAHLVGVDAGAVVGDLDDDAVALLPRRQPDRARGGLARAPRASSGVLDAVVDRVAHDVDERVVDLLEHLLVELGVAALDDEVDLLLELLRQVAHRRAGTSGRSC